jgi:hypothetical protein
MLQVTQTHDSPIISGDVVQAFPIIQSNASISNPLGELVAFTNGCELRGSDYALMENGDTLNPGYHRTFLCDEYGGYAFEQGALFLPDPGSDSLYYLFHISSGDDVNSNDQKIYFVRAQGEEGIVVVKKLVCAD